MRQDEKKTKKKSQTLTGRASIRLDEGVVFLGQGSHHDENSPRQEMVHEKVEEGQERWGVDRRESSRVRCGATLQARLAALKTSRDKTSPQISSVGAHHNKARWGGEGS